MQNASAENRINGEFEMKKTIIRLICLIFALVMICSVLTSCSKLTYYYSKLKYNENWMLGKTVEEITEKYGDYDRVFYRYAMDENDKYIYDENGELIVIGIQSIGYLVRPMGHGILGLDYDKYLLIWINNDGVACEIDTYIEL